jgi:hypothetical protein
LATIGSSVLAIEAQSAQFIRDMDRAARVSQQIAREMERQNARITQGFNAAAGAVKAFGVGIASAIGAGSLGSIARLGKQGLDAAGNIGELAQQAGVAKGELQAFL